MIGLILRYLTKKDWLTAAVCVVFILLQVYLDLKIPEYMNEITDLLSTGHSGDVILDSGVKMVVCSFLSLGVSLCAGILAARVAISLSTTLRRLQFEKVQSFSREDINRFSAASLITRSTNDVYNIQNFFARGLNLIIKSPILGIWAISKINSGAFEWTVTTAVFMVLIVSVMGFLMYRFFPYTRRIQWLVDDVNGYTKENLDGCRVIRAYNAEEQRFGKFQEANQNLYQNNIDLIRYIAPMNPWIRTMMNVVVLAIYWVGAGVIMNAGNQANQLNLFSDMIVFSTYATMVLNAVMMLVSIARMTPRAMVSMKRVEEVLDHEPAIRDGDVTDEGGEGVSVEFRDVSFSYPESDRDTLRDISFRVEPGQTFAIIGGTGSGKSTLVNLMARMYDADSGSVLIDGRDVREYTLEALRARIGYVPQKAIIFSGSVRDNVNFGRGSDQVSDDQVWHALDVAHATEFVERFDDKLDALISQHGRDISGGQKQRICIARAVCHRPGLYIFDDSFSALDFKTDSEVRASLSREAAGSTKVIIAQRIGTIMDADCIAVLSGGRIVGLGKHDELLRDCPEYREIAESQMMGGGPQ